METISKMEIYKKKISREAMMRYVYSLSVIEDGYENMLLGLDAFLESTEEIFEEVYENVVGKKIPENKFINEFYDGCYMKELCEKLSKNIIKIDEQIDKFARKWSVKTMPKVDVSIMRLAICEIMYMQSIPTAVSIDEAIELAKRYCDDKSPSFINGVLGSIADSLK